MHIFVYSFVFAFFAGKSLSSRPYIIFYEHDDFKGSVEIISYDYTNVTSSFGTCHRLNELNGTVQSVFTNGNCIALYSDRNCTGGTVYWALGSLYKKSVMNFYDKVSSFSSCDLHEKYVCATCPNALIPGKPEYEFWRYMFNITSQQRLEDFLRETGNGRSIDWGFLIPNTSSRPDIDRIGDLYEYALTSHMVMIELGQIRHLRHLQVLQNYAKEVIRHRESYDEPENLKSHSYVVIRAILDRWRGLSRTLDSAVFDFHPELNRKLNYPRCDSEGA